MSGATTFEKASVNDLTTAELYKLLCERRQQQTGDSFRTTLQLIDVRERHEIEASGTIAGSYNIPFSMFENDREAFVTAFQDQTDKDNQVIVYCRSGRRSRIVGEYMGIRLGYKDIYDMLGGLLAWEADRLPIQAHDYDYSRRTPSIFEKNTVNRQCIIAE